MITHNTHITKVAHDGNNVTGIEVDLWPGITVPIKRLYLDPKHRNLFARGTEVEITFNGEAANVNQIQSMKVGGWMTMPMY